MCPLAYRTGPAPTFSVGFPLEHMHAPRLGMQSFIRPPQVVALHQVRRLRPPK